MGTGPGLGPAEPFQDYVYSSEGSHLLAPGVTGGATALLQLGLWLPSQGQAEEARARE